jgi:ribosomal protein S18 acetylase RimI-like enzyme
MYEAQRFYEKHGFVRTDRIYGATGHYACEVKYIKEL